MYSFRLACRSLARRPAFATAATSMVALSIAITVATFSLVDTVLLKPLPFQDPDRLVAIAEAKNGDRATLVAPGRIDDWNRENQTFLALSGAYAESVTDASGEAPERISGLRVAPQYFAVFGTPALLGRTFTAEEERFGGPAAAVISEALWVRRYGRDPGVLGRAMRLEGRQYPIVGVMPPRFAPSATEVWLAAQIAPGLMRIRQARFFAPVGRLRPDVSIVSAQADLLRVQEGLGRRYPATDQGWSVQLTDLKEARVGQYRQTLAITFAAVALLLVIAVANVAGLMLIRLRRRAADLAIRQAIGGSRSQIVGEVMREATVLAVVGVVCGSVGASWLIQILVRVLTTIPRINELALDWRALLFSSVVASGSAVLFGLLPALHATRSVSSVPLATANLRAAYGRHALQQGLAVGQVALGIVVVTCAGLLLRTYHNLAHADAGFTATNVLTFHLGAAWNEDRTRLGQLQEQLIGELKHQPGIVEVGTTNFLPTTLATPQSRVKITGGAAADASGPLTVGTRIVSDGYLRALTAPLLAGAWCPPLRTDRLDPAPAIANRALADRYGQNLIGRHFTFEGIPGDHVIVGVVGNVAEDGAQSGATSYLYACQPAGEWPDPNYVVLFNGGAGSALAAVRGVAHRLAPDRALFGLRALDDVVAASLDQPRWNAEALTLFAGAAMGLASIGLYSLLMLSVAERTREMGVRIALGATGASIARLILGGALRLTATGVTVGLILTWATTRLLIASLFGITPLDPITIGGTIAAFGAVTLMAAAVPIWRVLTTDSTSALRSH